VKFMKHVKGGTSSKSLGTSGAGTRIYSNKNLYS
jgi:hypothetical protein